MPLKIASEARLDPLPGVNAVEQVLGVGSISLSQAKPFQPSPLRGVAVERMPAIVGAGVGLARLVLGLAGGSIVLLLVYLIWMDLEIGADVQKFYNHILNPSRIGSEFYTLDRLEHLSVDLAAAKNNPKLAFTDVSRENAESVEKLIDALPSVTIAQKHQLQACIPLPKDETRDSIIDSCRSVLDNVRQFALEAADEATNAQAASDAVAKTNEHRQNLHTFWIQAAQLILLNLLLPLLTALFGYIFGTQQTQKNS